MREMKTNCQGAITGTQRVAVILGKARVREKFLSQSIVILVVFSTRGKLNGK